VTERNTTLIQARGDLPVTLNHTSMLQWSMSQLHTSNIHTNMSNIDDDQRKWCMTSHLFYVAAMVTGPLWLPPHVMTDVWTCEWNTDHVVFFFLSSGWNAEPNIWRQLVLSQALWHVYCVPPPAIWALMTRAGELPRVRRALLVSVSLQSRDRPHDGACCDKSTNEWLEKFSLNEWVLKSNISLIILFEKAAWKPCQRSDESLRRSLLFLERFMVMISVFIRSQSEE